MKICYIDRESVRAHLVKQDGKAVLSMEKLCLAAGVGPETHAIKMWVGQPSVNPALRRTLEALKIAEVVVPRLDKGAVEVGMAVDYYTETSEDPEEVVFIAASGALESLCRDMLECGVGVKIIGFSDAISGRLASLPGIEIVCLDEEDIDARRRGDSDALTY
jgi:hypothetical protein